MIQHIELKNFQSHDDTVLDFHPGINVIVGESDTGKSAIMRALIWLINNRPSGGAFISHWNKNKKTGEAIEPTLISAVIGDKIVERFKHKDANGYKIGDKVLEAIKQDVPEVVSQLLNLEDINIQRQMDPPFLLSVSDGDVARYLNRMIRLDLIDRVLSSAEAKRRKIGGQQKDIGEDLEKTQKQLASFDWLPKAEKLFAQSSILQSQIESSQRTVKQLQDKALTYVELESVKQDADKIIAHQNQLTKIELSYDSLKQGILDIQELATQIESFKTYQRNAQIDMTLSESLIVKINNVNTRLTMSISLSNQLVVSSTTFKKAGIFLDRVKGLDKAIKLLDEIQEQRQKLSKSKEQFQRLSESAREYSEYITKVVTEQKLITELEESLPDVCPACGHSLEEGHNHV